MVLAWTLCTSVAFEPTRAFPLLRVLTGAGSKGLLGTIALVSISLVAMHLLKHIAFGVPFATVEHSW